MKGTHQIRNAVARLRWVSVTSQLFCGDCLKTAWRGVSIREMILCWQHSKKSELVNSQGDVCWKWKDLQDIMIHESTFLRSVHFIGWIFTCFISITLHCLPPTSPFPLALHTFVHHTVIYIQLQARLGEEDLSPFPIKWEWKHMEEVQWWFVFTSSLKCLNFLVTWHLFL